MRVKHILLTAIFLICSVSVFGQAAKNTSTPSTKAIVEKVQTLETNTQEQFSQLQNENKVLKEELQKMEKEIERYREDVRTETSRMSTYMALWFAALTLVIGGITAALGVAAPLFINNKNDERQKEKLDEITKKLNEASTDAKAAKADAESAKANSDSAKASLDAVQALKKDVETIKLKIEKSEENAKRAARRAIASKLFAEALAESEKNPQKAIELYTEVIKHDNKNAGAYNNRANLYKNVGKTNEAIADYNKAIESSPNDARAYYNRANLYRDLGKTDEAIADYNKAIELNPNNADTYNNRANLYKDLGKTNEAMTDYNKAIEINPNDAKSYNNRADFWLKLHQYDKALEDINRALSLDDKEYTHVYHITKGEIYMAMKEFLDAINELTLAISLKDDVKDAYKYRGECYRELAKVTRSNEKGIEYNALAESDEKKYEELDKKSNG